MGLRIEKISASQLITLIVSFIIGSSIIIPPGVGAGTDAWIAVLIGAAEGFVFMLIFIRLAYIYPGLSLVEILKQTYGKIAGSIIAMLYVIFFFHLATLTLNNFTHYFTSIDYKHTPKWVISILVLAPCIYALKKGIEILGRCSQFIVFIITAVLFLNFLLLIPEMHIEYIKPILSTPLPKLLWSAHGAATFPFGETIVFLMLVQHLDKKEKALSSFSLAILIGAFIFTAVAARNSMVLNGVASVSVFPTLITLQIVDISGFITRIEVLISAIYLFCEFIKCSVLLYACAKGIEQIFNQQSYKYLLLPFFALGVLVTENNYNNILEMLSFAKNGWPIYSLPFELIIPLITMITAELKAFFKTLQTA